MNPNPYLTALGILLFGWLWTATPLQAQQEGEASYYADRYHGNAKTASGEVYDKYDFTAAHRTLPFNTWVEVTNLDNGRSTRVRINDRGPFKPGRIIDLSRIAAEALDLIEVGVAQVRVTVISSPKPSTDPAPLPRPQPAPTPAPAPAPKPDLDGLPLVDEAGQPIQSNPNPPPVGMPGKPATPGTAGEASEVPATPPPIGLEDAQRYTPGLFRMIAYKDQTIGYGIQVGAYFNFYRLLEAMDDLAEQGYQNTLVQTALKGDKPVFRILIGPYPTRSDAERVRQSLRRKGKKGILLDLNTLR